MRFWRWAMLVVLAACFTQATAPLARADDPIACSFFFGADTSEMDWLPSELQTARCIERDRFEVRGRQYITVDLVGYDPANAAYRAGVVREAVMRGVNHYRTWFTVPEALFIFGRIGSLRRMSENGQALAVTQSEGMNCIVSVDDAATHLGRSVDEDRAGLVHTVAHELFHCVQQTDPDLHHKHVAWRDEGTAEFFSGRAIREAPYNNAYGRDLPNISRSPLYDLGEGAAPFIFYLGHHRGEDAVVELLRRATHGTDSASQVATLNTIAGVDTLFHDFARAWVDGRLVDQIGRSISLPGPNYGEATPIASAQSVVFETAPFMVTVRSLALDRGMAWGVESVADSDVRAVWRRNEEWTELRTTIDACREAAQGALFVTQTAGDGDSLYERNVEITEQPDSITPGCRCPIGAWTAGTEALREFGWSGIPGTLVDGSVSLVFEAGRVVGEYNELTFDTAIDRDSSMRTVLNGTVTWAWRRRPWDDRGGPRPAGDDVHDYFMLERTVTAVDLSWNVQFWARGSMISERSRPFPAQEGPGSVSFTPTFCTASTIRLLPHTRLGISAAPPWHGVFEARRG